VLRAHGRHTWNALLNFDQAATDLAFRKWHLSRGEVPKRHQAELSEEDLRREIAGLRARVHARTGVGMAPAPV
jgi:hypothetical protein